MRVFFLAMQLLFLQVEQTPEEHEIGLMGVETMSDSEGMLFVFPTSKLHSFWSYGCLISLDVGFLDENLILCEITHLAADPYWKKHPLIHTQEDLFKALRQNTSSYSLAISKESYPYVIELPSGWFKRHKIDIGSKLYRTDTISYFYP